MRYPLKLVSSLSRFEPFRPAPSSMLENLAQPARKTPLTLLENQHWWGRGRRNRATTCKFDAIYLVFYCAHVLMVFPDPNKNQPQAENVEFCFSFALDVAWVVALGANGTNQKSSMRVSIGAAKLSSISDIFSRVARRKKRRKREENDKIHGLFCNFGRLVLLCMDESLDFSFGFEHRTMRSCISIPKMICLR